MPPDGALSLYFRKKFFSPKNHQKVTKNASQKLWGKKIFSSTSTMQWTPPKRLNFGRLMVITTTKLANNHNSKWYLMIISLIVYGFFFLVSFLFGFFLFMLVYSNEH